MRKPKPLSKEMILGAMAKTKSCRAAARYIGVSYIHYKKWARLYKSQKLDKEGVLFTSLFEEHKNQFGVGIPKYLTKSGKEPALLDIIEGRADASSFAPAKIKYRLITEGYLEEKCAECGFDERRVVDFKMPLLLHFKDRNKKNYRQENIELLCYNHYFLSVGNIFTDTQIKGLEDHVPINKATVEWEMDDYTRKRLEELGLQEVDPNDDPNSLISRV